MTLSSSISTSLSALALLSLVACNNDPVGDAAKAKTSEVVAAPAKQAAPDALKLIISESNSSLGFVGAKITEKHDGVFRKLSGELHFVPGDIEKSSVKVSIDMDSLAIEPAKLAGHLKSPDFFDVAKFPSAKFESTKVEKADKGHTISGNLTLHGVTKGISFPATIDANADSVSVNAEFGINRKDFGIVYPGMPDDLIKDEVLIKLQLKPTKG